MIFFGLSSFQSTLPMRGATLRFSVPAFHQGLFQSTLPMRGATSLFWFVNSRFVISIHTPHAGSDIIVNYFFRFLKKFQSTLPMRGATMITHGLWYWSSISIHTPHAGSDDIPAAIVAKGSWISIHTPHAGSDFSSFRPALVGSIFQSTLPMRGATV